jgi:ATP-dependent DNA helicase RecQ
MLRKVLSGVARVRGYAGKRKIASMLMGSQSQEIAGSWLERLSTYGILEGVTGDFIGKVLDATLDAGYVATKGGRYPVLVMTPDGADVLASRCDAELSWPGSLPPVSGDSDVAAGPANQEVMARLQTWRRVEAARISMPPYVVFSNRSLDELARLLPQTLQELEAVNGFGPKRIAKHGEAILECILNG